MNITLRFRSYGLLSLTNCIFIDTQLDNRIVVNFLGDQKIEFNPDSADYTYFLFWIKHFDGPFDGGLCDVEDFYQETIFDLNPLEAIRYKSDVDLYEAI